MLAGAFTFDSMTEELPSSAFDILLIALRRIVDKIVNSHLQ